MPPKKRSSTSSSSSSKKSHSKSSSSSAPLHPRDEAAKERAEKKLEAGYAESTAQGEFVKETMDRAKEGELNVANRAQAVAIGLSKARKAGIGKGSGKKASKGIQPRARSSAPSAVSTAPQSKPSTTKRAAARGKTDTVPGEAGDVDVSTSSTRRSKRRKT